MTKVTLKGGSQLVHMNIRHHFIANYFAYHRDLIRTPFLTQNIYDKNDIIEWAKAHSKTGFQKTIEYQAKLQLWRLKWISRCMLISGWNEAFSKWEN